MLGQFYNFYYFRFEGTNLHKQLAISEENIIKRTALKQLITRLLGTALATIRISWVLPLIVKEIGLLRPSRCKHNISEIIMPDLADSLNYDALTDICGIQYYYMSGRDNRQTKWNSFSFWILTLPNKPSITISAYYS